jgi:hypothetical protein
MARHRQRDQEAGGDGLGVVETRKRLWEDVDGSVVKNRPSISVPGEGRRKRRRNNEPKRSVTEALYESSNVTSYQPELLSTAFDPTVDGLINEPLVTPHVYDGVALDCFNQWGLVSPPSSVDAIEFGQCSELEELLAQVECEF